ncbi:LacI family DNA-binding transcriptional regulator [Martelella limonii]|uniref:LacI family DNA-binding transcriptional regulator n=1 Tax=Martelella limonii TaxID=1647649 RepID=UPI00157FF048|nr:LacI family DNA-binding transcriptional regulator [Martelella limonii]
MSSSDKPETGAKARSAPASLRQVAKHAGVSVATVSRVINGIPNKASPETIKRVKAAVEALRYRPAGAAQALRRRESRIVAVLAASLINPVMAAITASIGMAMRECGLVMALSDTHESGVVQDEFLAEMRAQSVCGFVLLGAVESPELDRIRQEDVPKVFVNRPDPGAGTSCYAGMDNREAGRDVARVVLARGHRRAVLLHGSLDRTAATLRLQGIREVFAAQGLPADALMLCTAPGTNLLEVGRSGMLQALATGDTPPLVLCMSDTLAYGAFRALNEAGLDAPGRFTFFGFDDLIFNAWVAPWLNSAVVPAELYGAAVMQQLDPQTAAPALYLPHQLSIRQLPTV